MNLTRLFEMQQILDERIQRDHQLENEDLFERKVLALLVELGELANETRCFKFWSKKPSSSQDVILEEFVDGVHFILSLGIELKVHHEINHVDVVAASHQDVNKLFTDVYRVILSLKENPTKELYLQLLSVYWGLGQALSFNPEEIEKAYLEKNLINHERQNSGY
ncbi:dUTP diphosphatase [Bacillus pinisoli]|uniref:dUTP diphosphatase n=1 Tax=Bacillus pinisoli TaxID=2901866 RepID=UPI001FF4B022|nr:dUTP diphosphatase [Bacillus pinisoli]